MREVFFKRKNGWGSFSTQDFGTTKRSGSANGFEIKTKLLVLRCFYHGSGKEGKRMDTKTAMQLDILFPSNREQGGNFVHHSNLEELPTLQPLGWSLLYNKNNKSYNYRLCF
jgi:hypothetical protein